MTHDSDCGACKVEVSEGERAVACENCDDWYHTARVDVSKALYKDLDQGFSISVPWNPRVPQKIF